MTDVPIKQPVARDDDGHFIYRDRPIYTELPQIFSEYCNYPDVTLSGHLVRYWEVILTKWISDINGYMLSGSDLNNLSDRQIDYLAPLFGFIPGNNYDRSWSKDIKIKLLRGVYGDPYIWRFKGSMSVLTYLLGAFGLDVEVNTFGGFIVGVNKTGDIIGTADKNRLKLTFNYADDSLEFSYLVYILNNFLPITADISLNNTGTP